MFLIQMYCRCAAHSHYPASISEKEGSLCWNTILLFLHCESGSTCSYTDRNQFDLTFFTSALGINNVGTDVGVQKMTISQATDL